MGQEWSWPCASRDLQEKKLVEGKYDFEFLDQTQEGTESKKPKGAKEHKQTIKMEKMISIVRNNSVDSTTPSPSIATPYSFTDDSYYDQDANVIVVCEAIDDFEAFIASNMKKYNNEMVASCIVPHPFQNKAIVIFQTKNTVANMNLSKNPQLFDFEKDFSKFENNYVAYNHLIEFFAQQAKEGYDFLGYYIDKLLKYHFIFYQRTDLKKVVRLGCQVLDKVDENSINKYLTEASNNHWKLRGVITLHGKKTLSFAVHEMDSIRLEQLLIVPVTQDSLGTHSILDLSRKIEIQCQPDNFELTCLITNHQERLIYLAYSQ